MVKIMDPLVKPDMSPTPPFMTPFYNSCRPSEDPIINVQNLIHDMARVADSFIIPPS